MVISARINAVIRGLEPVNFLGEPPSEEMLTPERIVIRLM
jgi:hypothetical protein